MLIIITYIRLLLLRLLRLWGRLLKIVIHWELERLKNLSIWIQVTQIKEYLLTIHRVYRIKLFNIIKGDLCFDVKSDDTLDNLIDDGSQMKMVPRSVSF